LEIIDKAKNKNGIRFCLLFNYGPNNHYTNTVLEKARNIENTNIIDEFLPIDEFKRLYLNSSAFVMNGYRQMAVANILQAIQSGVKIYLNDRNIFKKWLVKEGFILYDVDDLSADIEQNNIKLSYDEMQENISQLNAFTKKYSIADFQSKLGDILR
jgi:hypothetical protein